MQPDSPSRRRGPSTNQRGEREPSRSRSIFDTRLSATDVAGAVSCPQCGREIPFRLQQVGATVACPACGEPAVRVGRRLLEDIRPAQQAVLRAPFSVLLVKRRWLSRRSGAAACGVALAALVLAGACVLAPGGWLEFDAGWLAWPPVAAERGARPPGAADVEGELPLPPPDVTLEAIEQLLQLADPREALVQAQVWRQILRDFRTPETDPRLVRLSEIIAELQEKLRTDPPPPPACLAEFRQALEDLREAIISRDLASGRAALARAEALFREHTSDLAVFGRSYSALKHRFERLVLALEGKAQIDELLSRAEQQINRDQPTEAAESLAAAMFKALRTPMEDAEFQERDQTVRRLEKELRFARGKRAVQEAEQCHAENDLQAREIQLTLAMELLPDLAADRVAPLLTRARELAAETVAAPRASPLGRRLAFRAAYEEALRFYGRRDMLIDLAERCLEAEKLFREAADLDDQQLEKASSLILETVAHEVEDLLSLPSHSADVAARLARARGALDKVALWRENPLWVRADSTLRSKGDEVAKDAIARATDAVLDNDLAGAIRLLEPALALGGPEVRAKAVELKTKWESHLAVQTRLAVEEEAWSDMIALYHEGEYLEVWRQLGEFETRFPDSHRHSGLAEVRRRLRPSVEQAVAQMFRTAEDAFARRNWAAYRRACEQLEHALLTPEAAARYAPMKETVDGFEAKANQLFLKTQPLHSMPNDSVIVQLKAQLDEVLQLNPDHEEAQKLRQRANERAIQIAQGLLLQARKTSPKSSRYVDLLQRVKRLNADENSVAQAEELLKKAQQ